MKFFSLIIIIVFFFLIVLAPIFNRNLIDDQEFDISEFVKNGDYVGEMLPVENDYKYGDYSWTIVSGNRNKAFKIAETLGYIHVSNNEKIYGYGLQFFTLKIEVASKHGLKDTADAFIRVKEMGSTPPKPEKSPAQYVFIFKKKTKKISNEEAVYYFIVCDKHSFSRVCC